MLRYGKTLLIGAAVVASVCAIAWMVLFSGLSAAEDISLQGITTAQLQSIGLELTVPNGSNSVAAKDAESVAYGVRPGGKVIETALVNMKKTGDSSEPLLAWAVNLDPKSITVSTHCPFGYSCPAPKLTFAIVFVDAKTGVLISAPVQGTSDDPVPVKPTAATSQ